MQPKTLVILASTAFLTSCGVQKKLQKSADQVLLNDPALQTAHVGVSIFDPSKNQYLFNYQGDKYFVPASNTKLPTFYAAMKYLGDSLPGLQIDELDDKVVIYGTGDPTLLHPDFPKQPVFDYLVNEKRMIVPGDRGQWQDNAWGSGWSWSDYDADYMPERSVLPVYGNVLRFSGVKNNLRFYPDRLANGQFTVTNTNGGYVDQVSRNLRQNSFTVSMNGTRAREIEVPFITSTALNYQLLADTLHKAWSLEQVANPVSGVVLGTGKSRKFIHSQPTDSMLRRMMYRSDNFYAEQSLLMVSNLRLGFMNDARIIDTILKSDLGDLPQKPKWVDGSGLSRYNLFTPQDFVTILNKMRSEFGLERLKQILPTGNTGTLTNYYIKDNGTLFAKTGTLSGVVALSGFFYTQKKQLLLFSVLVNNHQASATSVRRAVERFIQDVIDNY